MGRGVDGAALALFLKTNNPDLTGPIVKEYNARMRALGLVVILCAGKAHGQTAARIDPSVVDPATRMQTEDQRSRAAQQFQQQLEARPGRAQVPAPASAATGLDRDALPAVVEVRSLAIDFHSGPRIGKLESRAAAVRDVRMSREQLFALITSLNDVLIGEGYTTSYVRLIGLNHEDGILRVDVAWGRVDRVLRNGARPQEGRESRELRSAWPFAQDHVFNVADLDQAIENLSTLGKQATVSVQPSATPGFSTLDFTVTPRRQYQFSLSLDNSGTGGGTSGRYKAVIGLSVSDLLGLNEVLSLSAGSYYHHSVARDGQYPLAASVSVPYGRGRITFAYSNYLYERAINGMYGNYRSRGSSENSSVKQDYVLFRSQAAKISAFASYTYQKQANYIEGQRLAANSGTHDLLEAGLTGLYANPKFSSLSSLSIEKGVQLFSTDPTAYSERGLSGNAYRLKMSSQLSMPFNLGGVDVRYTALIGAQYSPYLLIPTLKLQIGDQYTLRAYKGEPFAGDSGVYLSHSLYFPKRIGGLSVEPYLGLDSGFLRNNDLERDVSVVDMALGMMLRYTDTTLNLSVGRTLWQRGAYRAGSTVLVSASTYF